MRTRLWPLQSDPETPLSAYYWGSWNEWWGSLIKHCTRSEASEYTVLEHLYILTSKIFTISIGLKKWKLNILFLLNIFFLNKVLILPELKWANGLVLVKKCSTDFCIHLCLCLARDILELLLCHPAGRQGTSAWVLWRTCLYNEAHPNWGRRGECFCFKRGTEHPQQ